MLVSLFVKDFAIVREIEIAPVGGLTVVSGETGAGKSLLVDALMLLTGARADAGAVRHGAERAELVARFAPAADSPALAWLHENDLDEDAECQLRRVIRADGGSRAWINGRPATVAQLAALGALLVEIHGQHEHQALLDRRHQLALLDAFARHPEALAQLRDSARDWQRATQAITALQARGDSADRRLYLEHQIAELANENLASEAIENLLNEHRRQSHATTLIEGCGRAAVALAGDLPDLLRRLRHELSRLVEHEPGLAEIDALLDGAQIQVDEAASALERLRDGFDLDPERLAALDARLARLHDLARKHRTTLPALAARQQALQQELDELGNSEAQLADLARARDDALARWRSAAAQVSAGRKDAATTLSTRVSAIMDGLGMAGGTFAASLEPIDGDAPQGDGAERVEFLVSANPGQPPRALRKVASGGELSRISLAIEVAAMGLDAVPTMVFDEVDTGIGGAVAEVVGQALRALGAERQVLCVTHLPQVAAQGHQHLRVSKADAGDGTQSRIEALDAQARVDELARMLGGVDITKATLAHARQMLDHAQRRG
ncbi:MAG: DNA repair protein RecN [Chiayiivirga sp.]|jgi:DNA repair protein RecN (Recombination protein N)|nr:DNA repair protein RecN [Chiayiivirga sp.]HRQ35905.1 DNA repair protein RecN [Chiayiivirga sp.]